MKPLRDKVCERLGVDIYRRLDDIKRILDENDPKLDSMVTIELVLLVRFFPQLKRSVWDASKLPREEIITLIGDDLSLVTKISYQIDEDDNDQSDRIVAMYEEGTPEQKKLLDDFCICLCGWSIETLLKQKGLGVVRE